MPRQGWPANSKDIYTHNAAMFSSKCETFALQVAYACGGTIFKVGGTSARQKNLKVFVICTDNCDTTALKFDVINFCEHVQANLFKIDKPSTTSFYTTPYLSYTTVEQYELCYLNLFRQSSKLKNGRAPPS